MRVMVVNGVAHPHLGTPEALLGAYSTLTGWSEALLAAGVAAVRVVQRFPLTTHLTHNGVGYAFRSDRQRFTSSSLAWRHRLVEELDRWQPHVVHINGTANHRDLFATRNAAAASSLVVQHHGEGFHADPVRRAYARRAFACADGFLFSALDQAASWCAAALIPAAAHVFEVMESSTTMRPLPRDVAQRRVALPGSPAMLWVGRLVQKKDPLSVLRALEIALASLPDAHLTFVYQCDDLLPALREYVSCRPSLRSRVHFRGAVDHCELPAFYNAADLLVSGSHQEGSGYAVIEALACGLTPVVTDIPSFRALTSNGLVGRLWSVGDARACAAALVAAVRDTSETQRGRIRDHFDRHLSWAVVGRRAFAIYREVMRASSLLHEEQRQRPGLAACERKDVPLT